MRSVDVKGITSLGTGSFGQVLMHARTQGSAGGTSCSDSTDSDGAAAEPDPDCGSCSVSVGEVAFHGDPELTPTGGQNEEKGVVRGADLDPTG